MAAHGDAGRPRSLHVQATDDLFDMNDPNIKQDIICMILQYLSNEGYQASKTTLYDEANVKRNERDEHQAEVRRLKKAILEGDWPEVDKLCTKPLIRHQKSFLYAVYRQQFLEYIEHHEVQKAFLHLSRRIKPLEHLQTTPDEFKDLCYLLTAKSVQDAPSFKSWEGIGPSRERLVEQFQNMLDSERTIRENAVRVPENRLIGLLQQAVAYQMEHSRYHSKTIVKSTSLLADYASFVIPNAMCKTFRGHRHNAKCLTFAGVNDKYILSGSSDNTLRLWNTESSECLGILNGHSSRVWDVNANATGRYAVSASSDRTVRIWDIEQKTCTAVLQGHDGDVYSACYHPGDAHVISGGYDRVVRMHDVETGKLVKTFVGHELSTTSVICNPLGNLIITGSKDKTIKFWDVSSGLCVRTMTSHLGEVTSVDVNGQGNLMLSCSKDNSNRLWDIRMMRPIGRLKGHQNTSRNFIRASFAHHSLVVGGSEDGIVYLWDQETCEVLQRLRGHTGIVYTARWSRDQGLFATASDDRTLRTWWYDDQRSLYSTSTGKAINNHELRDRA
ncbi:WD40-repeat-containing domain protein [Syncephalis pseudoplumigaleata]|uniref:WD40 repeat-containing protein SMU1 n=1 Tax=Syncephalis pseudoplumigaleata TaxID=1712513 RepID=A0A4V1J1Y4_9FUNG|nr:WD40-repeat-containing domain protein [Syncephalis pseudoplumigaleata]|eukprot:RKP26669.1 WD40-repeat-containing domain protein [Syncephalis pseudoplumigaleata]